MLGAVRQDSNKVATATSTSTSAPAVAASSASESTMPRNHGVHAHSTSYTTATQPNHLWTKNGSAGGPQLSQARVDAKIKSGTLGVADFKGMDPLQARHTIEAMTAGGPKQLGNLHQMMTDPTIADTLAKSLEYMKPEARRQLVHTVSDSAKSPEGAKIYKTFEKALDKATPSARNETLRESLLNGKDADHAVVNRYVAADGKRATSLVENLGGAYGAGADNMKLQNALWRLDQKSINTLLQGMSNLPEADSQTMFRTLGDAVMSEKGKFYTLRDKVWKALEQDTISAGVVLGNVARDNSGKRPDPDNKGQRLAMDILENMEPKNREAFVQSLRLVKGSEDVPKLLPKPKKTE